MDNERKCSKCGSELIKGISKGNFSANISGKIEGSETSKYMCTKCGYVEEFADNISFIKRYK